MDTDLAKKVAKEAAGRTRDCYLHQIGEPLLNPAILDIVEIVGSAGILTSMSTNAVLLDEKMAAGIIESRLNELILCLDGVTLETYGKLRSSRHFARVLGNIDAFLRLRREAGKGPQTAVQLIEMRDNKGEIERFKREYEPKVRGIGRLWVKQYSRFAGYVEDLSPTGIPPRRFSCSYPFTHMAIHWNGDACICCRDFDGFTKVGNVKEQTIQQIWDSKVYESYRNEFRDKSFHNVLCRNC